MEDKCYLGLWIDIQVFNKVKRMAAYEMRSASAEILYLIQCRIKQHEKEYGPLLEEDF